jgi:6-phosphogluconolactonase (cycloisomerase 2 family)
MRTFVRKLALMLGSLLVSSVLALPASAREPAGTVYTLSNDPAGNAVVVFDRARDGTLSAAGSVQTDGLGSGDALGSQGALVLSDDGRWLLAVNAGSDEVSLLSVTSEGLQAADVASSGGDRPISVTIHGRLVYVLNDGSDSVSGLRVRRDGTLTPIARSTVGLSGPGIDPAQVEFTPSGDALVVTEKNTNLIDVYEVGRGGRVHPPNVQDSEGETPFGFAFDPSGHLIVSEAFGGAPGASALSSYAIEDSTLTTISASVPDNQAAACWVVVTPDGKFTYTTNTGSDTISGYSIDSAGALTLFAGAPFATGDEPIDMALAGDAYLYALNASSHDISAFSLEQNGSLTSIAGIAGLPPTSVGLASS